MSNPVLKHLTILNTLFSQHNGCNLIHVRQKLRPMLASGDEDKHKKIKERPGQKMPKMSVGQLDFRKQENYTNHLRGV